MTAARRFLSAVGLATVMALPVQAQGPNTLALSTGEVTGFYYPLGGAVCRLVNKDRAGHGLRCLVEPTAGNAANLAALKAGETDLAVVQARAHRLAFLGQDGFAETGALADLRSLASLPGEELIVLAADRAKVKSLKDLKGKKVNLGRPGSFQRLMAEAALAAAGADPAGFAASLEMDLAQQEEGLCDGTLDVAFFSGLHPMPLVQEILAECEVKPLDLSGVAAADLTAKAPFLSPHSIPAEAYQGVEKDVGSLAMRATLVGSAKLAEDTAYRVVKTMLDNIEALSAMHPLLAGLDKAKMAADGLAAPLHEGAVRAYREAGVRP